MPWVIGLVVVAVVLVTIAMVVRNRSAHNSVDSFRRQIDALGPEARRSVVDQVQTVRIKTTDPDAQPGDAQPGDAQPGDAQPGDAGDGDGARGA